MTNMETLLLGVVAILSFVVVRLVMILDDHGHRISGLEAHRRSS